MPASTSNLGSGFDCFGMALQIYLTVEMEIHPPRLEITAHGEGRAEISTSTDNLIYLAAKRVFEQARQELPPLSIKIENEIPIFRGLGSSGAATVAGLLCGTVLAGTQIGNEQILQMANGIEGHPENAAASLLGGATINCLEGDGVISKRIAIDEHLEAVLLIPDTTVSTHAARSVLPKMVAHEDAVFNLQRSALLSYALISGDYKLLRTAMDDRLHQPYRKHLIPHYDDFVRVGYLNGALGISISGSGSAVIALTKDSISEEVATAWEELRKRLNVSGKILTAGFENRGAEVTMASGLE